MSFIEKIKNYIDEYNMLQDTVGLVVGISGGADSVCLMLALCRLADDYGIEKQHIYGVHINHMLRGAEAERDEAFVKGLCDRLGVSCFVFKKDIGTYAKELGCSVEEAGRIYRYMCFEKIREKKGANKIAVAHNKGDLAETVIFNIIRGSGLKGLSGIAPVRDAIIRPLLGSTRNEIEAYLDECNQDFCNDSTNGSTHYDRNKIRHNIIPQMEAINSNAVSHICDVAEEAQKSYGFIHDRALKHMLGRYAHNLADIFIHDEVSNHIVEEHGHDNTEKSIIIDIENIKKENALLQEHIVKEAITNVAGKQKDIGRKHIKSVIDLIYGATGKQMALPYNIIARRSYDKLIISNFADDRQAYNIEISEPGMYVVPGQGSLWVRCLKKGDIKEVSKKRYTKMADYGKIHGKFCIRTPEPGDYIIIDGMGNSKKLSRVFIDNKIDRNLRDTWPVVACGSEIIWAVGLRYNVNYKIDDDTQDVLYMEYKCEGEENG